MRTCLVILGNHTFPLWHPQSFSLMAGFSFVQKNIRVLLMGLLLYYLIFNNHNKLAIQHPKTLSTWLSVYAFFSFSWQSDAVMWCTFTPCFAVLISTRNKINPTDLSQAICLTHLLLHNAPYLALSGLCTMWTLCNSINSFLGWSITLPVTKVQVQYLKNMCTIRSVPNY